MFLAKELQNLLLNAIALDVFLSIAGIWIFEYLSSHASLDVIFLFSGLSFMASQLALRWFVEELLPYKYFGRPCL